MLRYLLVALLASASAAAMAQSVPTMDLNPSFSPPALPVLRGGAVVLYDQTSLVGTQNFPSQEFEESRIQFNSQGADDFTVPDSMTWSISEVSVIGAYRQGDGPATNVDVRFYVDDNGRPGSRILSYTDLSVDSDVDGDLTVTLSPSAILPAGTYWVSFLVDMDALVEGQWFWTKQATEAPIGAELHWRNPGNGFGLGCTTWQPLNTVCGDDGGFDASFRLGGEAAEMFVGFDPQWIAGTLEEEEEGVEPVTIFNNTDRIVTYEFDLSSVKSGFITGVSPVRGEIPAGGTVDVEVMLSAAGIRPGVYADTLIMASNLGGSEVMHTLPVELAVTAFVGLEEGAVAGLLALSRNYPNPFTSETTIELTVLEAGPVTVEVYDALGRRVGVLVDEERSAGQHLLRWNARGASSGVYVVLARAGAASVRLPVALVR